MNATDGRRIISLLTRILKERKHEKHSESQYTTFGNVELKRFGHFVTFSIFNTAYKNDLLLEVVVKHIFMPP